MARARQASMRPTNKLTIGSVFAGIFGTQIGPVVIEVWPAMVMAPWNGPVVTQTVSMTLAALVGIVVGRIVMGCG
jgi:hypothetical protein